MRCWPSSTVSFVRLAAAVTALAVGSLAAVSPRAAAAEVPARDALRVSAVDAAVRSHLERRQAGTWSRFDVLEVRWSSEAPSPDAELGVLSGDPRPTANGTLALTAEVLEAGLGLRRLPLSVSVRPWVRVPVAARPIARGATVGPDDLREEEIPASELRGARPLALGDALSLRARRDFRPGDPVTEGSVEEPPLVTSGSRVTIRYASGSLRLQTAGVARRSGRRGEWIPVQNLDSRRTVVAEVVAAGVVEPGR